MNHTTPVIVLCTYLYRALARIGNVHFKKGEWEEAVKEYNHSLAEHRNQDIVKKKNEVSSRLHAHTHTHTHCVLYSRTEQLYLVENTVHAFPLRGYSSGGDFLWHPYQYLLP